MDSSDKEFLNYYNNELTFINHNAEQFAKNNPKIAAQLQIAPNAKRDPHVERLVQSVAFMNARIRYKLDDDMGEAASSILSILMPNLLSPIPSMSIVQFNPEGTSDKIDVVERGRQLEFMAPETDPCIFETCYDTDVVPAYISSAKLVPAATQRVGSVSDNVVKSVLNIKLFTNSPSATFAKMAPSRLRFFISANEVQAYKLYDLVLKGAMSIKIATNETDPDAVVLPAEKHIRQVGFDLDQSLLPYKKNAFVGYRLLSELFSFPRKFLFFDVVDIDPSMLAHLKNELQLYFYLNDCNKDIENFVNKEFFAINCSPVVNLFKKSMEPLSCDWREPSYRIIPDIDREGFYDIYDIQKVTTITDDGKQMESMPFYSIRHDTANNPNLVYWACERRPATFSASTRNTGDEMFLSFSDVNFNLLSTTDSFVAHIEATVSNGNAPSLMPFGDNSPNIQFYSKHSTVKNIKCLVQPTPTYYNPQRSGRMWTLVSLLVLNYLSLVDTKDGADALKQILSNFDYVDDGTTANMINSILSISSEQALARDPSQQLNAFCKGLAVMIELDQTKFEGSSWFLFGSVLENFLSMYAAINSFVKLKIVAAGKRKVMHEWKPRTGNIALL